MNKLFVVLTISTVIMSGISGLLFYQLNVVQNENKELNDDLFEVNAQLEKQQNTSLQFESQVTDLLNQTEHLEQSLVEVKNQKDELEEQLNEATNRVEIVKLSARGCGTIAGLVIESFVNVTIENFGINDVENLVLTIEMNSSDYFTSVHNVTIIQTGEKIVIPGRVWYHLLDDNGLIVATLELNNQISDEYKISISDAMQQN